MTSPEELPSKMIDNQAPSQQDQMNTVFLEERAIHSETTSQGASTAMASEPRARMTDMDWMASQQLLKPVLISQVEWSIADEPGKILKKFEYPECITSIESLITRTLRIYAFFKISPVFRFQLNGTKFHQGQLICSWDPFAQALDAPQLNSAIPYCNRHYATGLPNIKIMASESDPAELEIPFIHPRDYLTTNSAGGFDILGQIRIQVLNQLQIATGSSPTLTLSVWIYGRDAEVHVPMQDHNLNIPDFLYAPNVDSHLTSTAYCEEVRIPIETEEVTTLPEEEHEILIIPDQNLTSTGLMDILGVLPNLVSKGTNIVGNVVTGNFGQALRTGQGLIDDLGEAFGFDYPTRPLAPEKTISPIENMAVGKGASRSHRLAVDPMSMHEVDPALLGSPEKDMDALKIAKTPMLLDQYYWKDTADPGQRLMKIPISPMTCKFDTLTIADQTYDTCYPTYLSYISSYFCYWSGGITYDFEIVATGFHSGKLVAAFVPNNTIVDPTYQDMTAALPAITMDIQQTSKFSFTVPYVSPTPMKVTRNTQSDESVIGYLYVNVMNRLVHPSNVASMIDINVYIRGADDYSLYVPRPTRMYEFLNEKKPIKTSFMIESDYRLTSTADTSIEIQEERSTDSEKVASAVLSAGQKSSSSPQRFGESYSLRDMIRRFCYQLNNGEDLFSYTDTENSIKGIYVTPRTWYYQQIFDTRKCYSYLDHLSMLYAAWSGSIRYKFVCPAPRTSYSMIHVVHEPDSVWTDSIPIGDTFSTMTDGYGHTLTTTSQDNCLEVEVPYYSPWNMLLTMPSSSNTPSESYRNPVNNGMLLVSMKYRDKVGAENALPIELYKAAGDDFKFFYLRAPPQNYATNNGDFINPRA